MGGAGDEQEQEPAGQEASDHRPVLAELEELGIRFVETWEAA